MEPAQWAFSHRSGQVSSVFVFWLEAVGYMLRLLMRALAVSRLRLIGDWVCKKTLTSAVEQDSVPAVLPYGAAGLGSGWTIGGGSG
jgi:hypothetical protein